MPDTLPEYNKYDSPDADGWTRVWLRFDIEEAACTYVLGFGAQMQVIEPLELRDHVLQAAKEAILLYAQQ
ncbi:WYL domain-containing protein [Nostoc sp.]|uniref:WYL domain-containing protein n=1 Tax=Nostoc sp. TaxID=1180 RepID=UPI002FF7B545